MGSYREFQRGNCTDELIEEAMQMPGGGHWRTQPGQVTDDSELAMCQMRGLLAGKGKLDLFHHALYYGYWIHYDPFDIGRTTINGLFGLKDCLNNPDPSISHEATKNELGS